MALIASLTHPQSRVVLTSFRSGTCSCLKSLNDKESYVVSRTAPVGPLGYVAMNEIDHFARTQVPATAHRSHQTIAAIFFERRILRFRYSIGVEHQHFAGIDGREILVIARVAKHSQRHAAPLFETDAAILIH